jgi:DNA-binding response OmpR family regulator
MTEKQKILIVDDDENIAELISLYLTKECFDTKIVGDGSAAIDAVASYHPDLMLLDIMLPGMNGYDVLREIRKSSTLPVIMLSAKGETFDKVLGLELGADDYIMKPFDTKELMARIKAVLRRSVVETPAADISSIPKECVNYPGLMINLTDYSVYYEEKRVEMPPKELELFYFLASHPNQVFTREQLLDNIWSYDYIGDTRTVDVHIKRLREKFPEATQWNIATVWGVGYKFEYRD